MKLYHRLKYWYLLHKAERYSRKAKNLHHEMREMMTPYVKGIKKYDIMARNARISASMTLSNSLSLNTPKQQPNGLNGLIVQQ